MSYVVQATYYTLKIYHTVLMFWNSLWRDEAPKCRYYLLSNDSTDLTIYDDDVVPENDVCIEEWTHPKTGEKKCRVFYENEDIPMGVYMNPFYHMHPYAKHPWVWVGDTNTEIDLTKMLHKFLVPGNLIDKRLIGKFLQLTDHTKLQYLDSTTYEMRDFPDEGIVIEEAE